MKFKMISMATGSMPRISTWLFADSSMPLVNMARRYGEQPARTMRWAWNSWSSTQRTISQSSCLRRKSFITCIQGVNKRKMTRITIYKTSFTILILKNLWHMTTLFLSDVGLCFVHTCSMNLDHQLSTNKPFYIKHHINATTGILDTNFFNFGGIFSIENETVSVLTWIN